jgi:hypothetical protein
VSKGILYDRVEVFYLFQIIVPPVSGKMCSALNLLCLSGLLLLKCQNVDHIDREMGRLPEIGSLQIPIMLKLRTILMCLLGCVFAYIHLWINICFA